MKLRDLRIELETYGDNKGRYIARIDYENPTGNIKLILTPDVSEELLKHVGPMLNKFALNGMAEIQNAIVAACQQPAAEQSKEKV